MDSRKRPREESESEQVDGISQELEIERQANAKWQRLFFAVKTEVQDANQKLMHISGELHETCLELDEAKQEMATLVDENSSREKRHRQEILSLQKVSQADTYALYELGSKYLSSKRKTKRELGLQYLIQAAEDKHVLSLNKLIEYYDDNPEKQKTYKELLRSTLLETDEARTPRPSPTGTQQTQSPKRFFSPKASELQDDRRKSAAPVRSPRRSPSE